MICPASATLTSTRGHPPSECNAYKYARSSEDALKLLAKRAFKDSDRLIFKRGGMGSLKSIHADD
jgi:hypothetical protein